MSMSIQLIWRAYLQYGIYLSLITLIKRLPIRDSVFGLNVAYIVEDSLFHNIGLHSWLNCVILCEIFIITLNRCTVGSHYDSL